MTTTGEVYRLSISAKKGEKKNNVDKAVLIAHSGIIGDAHSGSKRQVSLLPFEAFDVIRIHLPEISPGDFAENITTQGIDLSSAAIGDQIYIGGKVKLVITHIGKECHKGCHIREKVGDCIMPRLGLFASVAEGGNISIGDTIRLEKNHV